MISSSSSSYPSRSPPSWKLLFLLLLPCIRSLTPPPPHTTHQSRRDFVAQSVMIPTIASMTMSVPNSASALTTTTISTMDAEDQTAEFDAISSLLDAKSISWNGPSWRTSRYRTSTLSASSSSSVQSNNSNTNFQNYPTPSNNPLFYPDWMRGYFTINYKFKGASFPQGRKILSLRTAGAGLGTCLSLPNVGYSPPSPHAIHFCTTTNDGKVYDDLAYNLPRRLEAFWPEAKVLGVQTNGGYYDKQQQQQTQPQLDNTKIGLSPKCFVTGEGCTTAENPNLHMPSSRAAMEFEAPTRRNGRMRQSCDVTLLNHQSTSLASSSLSLSSFNTNTNSFATINSYSQLNVQQELQTFYKEISTFQLLNNAESGSDTATIAGKIRVAAFLPKYIKDMDAGGANVADDYIDNDAVAIYDYKFLMKSVDDFEAASV